MRIALSPSWLNFWELSQEGLTLIQRLSTSWLNSQKFSQEELLWLGLHLGQGFRKPHILTTFCSKNATSTCRTFTKLYNPVENLEAFLCVKFHLSSPSGTYLSANPRWHFWGRGSKNHTFWPLFALKTQLLLSCTFTKLYRPFDMGKAFLHVEGLCSSMSGTYLSANPRCISANPSWCSNSETAWSIFFKFTVQSYFVANLIACETAIFYLHYFWYFSLEVLPKKCKF